MWVIMVCVGIKWSFLCTPNWCYVSFVYVLLHGVQTFEKDYVDAFLVQCVCMSVRKFNQYVHWSIWSHVILYVFSPGSDVVDWLMRWSIVRNRENGSAMAQTLLKLGHLQEVDLHDGSSGVSPKFNDGEKLYRFVSDLLCEVTWWNGTVGIIPHNLTY